MSERARLGTWLLWLALLALTAAWQWQRGIQLDTDILALLPEASGDALRQRATSHSAEQGEGLVLWLVGAADRSQALDGVRWLEEQLTASSELEVLQYEESRLPELLQRHRHALLSLDDRQGLERDPAGWLTAKQAALYGPAGWQRAVALADDPLYLQGDYLLSLLPEGDFDSGHALRCEPDRCYAALVSRFAGQRFALDEQVHLLTFVARVKSAAEQQGLEVLAGGLPLFIAEATVQAQREINTIGLGSTIGIIALLWISFRSLRALLLPALALLTGISSAALACLVVFGRVHMLTLVFGASLVGVAIDYALHWLCNRFHGKEIEPLAEPVLLRALVLALVTSLTGFGLLTLAPFPGLRQIALFFAAGLAGAWLTVVLAFPLLGRRLHWPWRQALGGPDRVKQAWSRWGQQHWTWLVGGACILLAGLARLEPGDDLRMLQAVPSAQLADYQRLQQHIPFARDSQFFLVRGADSDAVLEREARLLQQLDRHPEAVLRAHGLSVGIPAISAQRATQADLLSLCESGALHQWLDQLGADHRLATAECDRIKESRPIELEDWLAVVGPPWEGLWLGCDADDCASLVPLTGVRDLTVLQQIAEATEGAELVDPVAQISTLLGHYRQAASRWLAWALVLVAPVLMWRLGLSLGARAALVPTMTVLSVLATLGWLGVPFSLFNLMALLVVGGISVDYAVFNAVGGGHPATALAVALAALTTLLGFGLLSLSQTPLVAAFGLTLALGIGYAVVWAPLWTGRG